MASILPASSTTVVTLNTDDEIVWLQSDSLIDVTGMMRWTSTRTT